MKLKSKIFFDNSVVWMAVVVGIATVVVADQVHITKPETNLGWPIDRLDQREKKLTFGLYVTPDPENNPIDPPERFTGYHSALDVEVFPDELDLDVPIVAACDGRILEARQAQGYGGVVVQACKLNGADITVLYGHLDYHNFKVKIGDKIKRGENIGILGAHREDESGFNRKHLHFGVHKGKTINLLGYVQKETDLLEFMDPVPLLGL